MPSKKPVDLGQALLGAWDTSERMNQFLLEHLDPQVWRADPPLSQGRTIARSSRTCTTCATCGWSCRPRARPRRRSSSARR